MKKKLTIGILAHVDAGKTTLSEALLYLSGKIRRLGRVDHGDTYLDTNALERERGITIFSKQARFSTDDCDFILLDTPGHVDFCAETERVLALLDYAVLVVSAADGVQNHTRTLWQLLDFYGVPTFIFVNKTDIAIKLADETTEELKKTLSPCCVAFYEKDDRAHLDEKLALIHEDFLESFLSGVPIEDADIALLIKDRALFPCFFGSALKMTGVEYFLRALDRYTLMPIYDGGHFGAKVYKISHAGPQRLTYMKITGGVLRARDEITYISESGEKTSEKVSQIRLYSGDRFEQADSVSSGEICAVTGLTKTYVGAGLGLEADACRPILEPILSYRVILPDGCDPMLYFPRLKELEEEDPSLHIRWNEELNQIEATLMGEIQIDLLKRMISERLGIDCGFGAGKILYKEQIKSRALGIGHFEPLRHYAEVQLLLEPGARGSGLVFDVDLPENSLDMNWQRLILSNLYEKTHKGVLTGAELTDTKITLVAAKAHQKHTEGGDFREAALRAVRQGLMRGGCVLLEPYCKFRLEIPSASVGRAMSDLQARSADFEIESSNGEVSVITGKGPATTLHGYVREVIAYTRGEGKLSLVPDGYYPCHNEEEVVAAAMYDPVADLENPPHSVFCEGGSGFVVPWFEVEKYKHLEVKLDDEKRALAVIPKASSVAKKYRLSEKDLEAIMLRTFGPIKRRKYSEPKIVEADDKKKKKPAKAEKNLTIIDGYNLIHAWDELSRIAEIDLEKARGTLMDILSSYVAYTKNEIVLVFDAYLVKGGAGSESMHDGYKVVFTKENETADAYIEKMMHELGPDYSVRVVTGDRLLQFSAVVSGIFRMTSEEFIGELKKVGDEITEFIRKLAAGEK